MLPLLHVAALPFPSHQGTQAAIRFMLEAEARALGKSELLTYAHGSGSVDFVHHRARALWPDRSLRSGPSPQKIVNDLGLLLAARRLDPAVIVAHHVEAAALASLLGRPWVFCAHTALGPELPTYLPPRWSPVAHRLGDRVDRWLGRAAGAVAAVSPLLGEALARRCERPVHTLPIPWPLAAPIDRRERAAARTALGLAEHEPVVLYAGNLDGYQGADVLFAAMLRLGGARLVLATESSVATLPAALALRTTRTGLGTEADRRRAHAAADVAAVPRHAPGGLPVKLLDALARGVPVAAAPRALAGSSPDAVSLAAHDDCPEALAAAITAVLDRSTEDRAALGERGRAWIARHHGDAAYLAALQAVVREATHRAG